MITDDNKHCTYENTSITDYIISWIFIIFIFVLIVFIMICSVLIAWLIDELLHNKNESMMMMISATILMNKNTSSEINEIYQKEIHYNYNKSLNKDEMILWTCSSRCSECVSDGFYRECKCGVWSYLRSEGELKCNELCNSSCKKVLCKSKNSLVCFSTS